MWKAAVLMCVILIVAAWEYRPAKVILGPGKGAFIVTDKGATEHPATNALVGVGIVPFRAYTGHWVALRYRGVAGGDYNWGRVWVLPEPWAQLQAGDGFAGDVFMRRSEWQSRQAIR